MIVLRGYKDPTTNLWNLPLTNKEIVTTTPEEVLRSPNSAHMMLSHHVEHAKMPIHHAMVPEQPSPCVIFGRPQDQNNPTTTWSCKGRAPCNPIVETAGFFYAQTTKANNVKIAHQSFCNPPIASLLKAINAGFLKRALHLDTHMVQNNLFASPATSKGQMKQPCKGIWSTSGTKPKKATQLGPILPRPQRVEDDTMPGLNHPEPNNNSVDSTTQPHPNLIQERNMPGALPKITRLVIVSPLLASTLTPFAVLHMIKDTPPVATAHKVPQQRAWKTKTVAIDKVPQQST
jgi:hypothetical protein